MLTKTNLGLILCLGFAQLSNQICENTFEQGPGTYYYYSTNYPDKDSINMCRMKLIVPQDHVIFAECDIDIDKNNDGTCDMTLYISRDGNLNLNAAHAFCGYGKVNLTSNFNSMAFAYESNQGMHESKGRVLCKLSVLPIEPIKCECGWSRSTKIIGGSDAEVGEFPSMAGVVSVTERDVYCGGTIISNRLVVTAKHCIENERPDTIAIAVGFVNRTGRIGESGAIYRIKTFHMPPNTTGERNDIALLQTMVNIVFSYAVGPACLPYMHEIENIVSKEVSLVGWGTTEYSGSKSDVLQKVSVNIIPNSICKAYFNELEETNFCTYAPEKDSCQFDSGGPVYLQEIRQFLVGVIRYGNRCAEDGGVHTKITPYLQWIQFIAQQTTGQLCLREFN